ncbi:uncharacterized protein BDV14DRAFT_181190 [Aspergillus stella-maris]|uniref:uncharacterized protein n=1 Tax=Aspergillus stella-maris TaxID=1810926 RepID=UPI003CCCF0E7
MDTKHNYNGYPAAPPSWGQDPPAPPAYGYPQQPYGQYPPHQPPFYDQQNGYPPQSYPPQSYSPTPPSSHLSSHPSHSPQPSYAQAQNGTAQFPRTLDVAFTSWSGRHMKVTENTSDGPLVYAADLHNRKPHMIFQATGTAHLPATVQFHCWSRKIDISINGNDVPMKGTSHWKYEYAFDSHAFPGQTFTWKRSKSWLHMNVDCVDENGTVLAHFKASKGWSGKKAGKLEIYEAASKGGKAFTDELVVTGLANVYLQLSQTAAANSAAASSASVSAAVSV